MWVNRCYSFLYLLSLHAWLSFNLEVCLMMHLIVFDWVSQTDYENTKLCASLLGSALRWYTRGSWLECTCDRGCSPGTESSGAGRSSEGFWIKAKELGFCTPLSHWLPAAPWKGMTLGKKFPSAKGGFQRGMQLWAFSNLSAFFLELLEVGGISSKEGLWADHPSTHCLIIQQGMWVSHRHTYTHA